MLWNPEAGVAVLDLVAGDGGPAVAGGRVPFGVEPAVAGSQLQAGRLAGHR